MNLSACLSSSDKLRAIAGNTSHIKTFFNSLHTVCIMYGLSIYEIKMICHHARFFII